ncbi:hypothetical protein [Pseudotabrizicola algicola]|uniref:Arginine transporter n=1 Tax=Pseudotabrizicola algicola TaxID=2709381 RepID=A0A6B3RPA6_9RHOB|nr:hypothetical protein [Pseudotabrizicola algicola]NEX47311.1 hypothetical protein [Pseudotabrizicola algicola]
MKPVVLAACAAMMLSLSSGVVLAGPIERACLNSDRKAATRPVCACVQQVADMTLRGGDQRKAASFFKNPDRAQKVRMSKSDNDNEFWRRYKAFGEQAEAYCATS